MFNINGVLTNKVMIKTFFFVTLMLISSLSISAENDFDKLCGYFKDLSAFNNKDKMTKTQRLEFINKRVNKELSETSLARQAWEVVIYAVPEERYALFKSTTVELLGKEWSCNEMQALLPNTGD